MSKENFAEKMKTAKVAKKTKEEAETKEEIKEPVKITSTEIEIISSEFHNFGNTNILFEKNKPTFVTEEVLDKLLKMSNFQALVDKGVITIGL